MTRAMPAVSSASTRFGFERWPWLRRLGDPAFLKVKPGRGAADKLARMHREGTADASARGATNGQTSMVEAQPEVLVVDDEPITARGYARSLAAAGFKVTVAHDGREAAGLAK